MADDETSVWVIGQFIGRTHNCWQVLDQEFVYLEDPLMWKIAPSPDDPTKPRTSFYPLPGVEYVEEAWVRLGDALTVYEAGPGFVRAYTEAVASIREQAGMTRIQRPTDAQVLSLARDKTRG